MTELLLARALVALLLLGAAALLVWLARAGASGRLERNQVAGIRTRATLASDEAWLAAHRRAEGATLWAAGASALTGVLVFLPVGIEALSVVVVGGTLVMLGFVLYGAKVGVHAAREVEAREG